MKNLLLWTLAITVLFCCAWATYDLAMQDNKLRDAQKKATIQYHTTWR